MGMFDGILGGAVGAEMATVVNNLIEKHGGRSRHAWPSWNSKAWAEQSVHGSVPGPINRSAPIRSTRCSARIW